MSGTARDDAPLGAAHGRVRIADLGADTGRLFDEGAGCLHYCAPTHGGWGVLRTALLVPEMYVLFVCPAACGRHGAIAAFEQGQKDRVGYLCIEDDEIVLGSYEDEIRKTVPLLMERLAPRPKAFMIVVSCIDDLLGTDYAPMVADFEAAHGIPFRVGRMNPITMGSGLPPQRRIQRDMYDYLVPAPERDGSIGLIGPFLPLHAESELHGMLARAGLGPIRHIGDCATFAEFQRLAAVRLNLVTRPEGIAAAETLQKTLGTPFVIAPVAFSEAAIGARYAAIAAALGGVTLDPSAAREEAERAATRAHAVVGDRTLAIDSTATCSPFDLSRALIERGFAVVEVVAHQLPAHERPAFDWLAANAPDLIISSPIHPARSWSRPDRPTADIAIGFSAGYLTAAPVTVPISFDEGLFGFHGLATVLDALAASAAAARPEALEDMVRAYGLVV
ncbi:hypothetical protein CCR97_14700 [Rhodoplanes elegans]|uniref:Nitrogenase/oxidoreductase component 1 domain-containing protein n=1 Tax=Rhodoplanes elegans TaxID=29408 RepID=A0A327KQ92_9BRAD|nr:nitrogenase component 1 [Rhodoplanes elegans]MBK5959447.1 hypothetical protein [Rhodoplanes elegans]RAI39495.1 hypothetical protein CH338_09245 [Rhodoplanes elegans]